MDIPPLPPLPPIHRYVCQIGNLFHALDSLGGHLSLSNPQNDCCGSVYNPLQILWEVPYHQSHDSLDKSAARRCMSVSIYSGYFHISMRKKKSPKCIRPHTPLFMLSMLSILFTHSPGLFLMHTLHGQQVLTINTGLKLVDIQPRPGRATRDDHCKRFGNQKLPSYQRFH